MISTLLVIGKSSYNMKQKKDLLVKNSKLLTSIKSHYHDKVITNKEAILYEKKKNKYQKIGTIAKDEILFLENNKLTINNQYFKIKGIDYYIKYKDVIKITKEKNTSGRYKNYLLFNENIKTKKNFSLYKDEKIVYKFNKSMEFSILIKEDTKYGVIFNDELYYILTDEIEGIYESINRSEEISQSIPVTVYHFLYDEGEKCNEIICNSKKQVIDEFNYLRDNNYYTLNTKEVEYFIDGKINLPKNSILITIDDGARATKFLDILNEYKMNATLFLITSWYNPKDFSSEYLELASHTHNLHTTGICEGGQGSPLKCANREELLNDLRVSKEKLNQTEAFCYPFYEYNQYAIDIVKEAGFKTAYIGDNKRVSIGIDKLKIPRITIYNNISIQEYINLINK